MINEVQDPKKSPREQQFSYVDDRSIVPGDARAAFGGARRPPTPTPSTPPSQPAEAGGDSKVEDLQSFEEFQNQFKELNDEVTKLKEVVNSQLTQNASPADLVSLKDTLASHNKEIQLLLEKTIQQDTLINSIQLQLGHQADLLGEMHGSVKEQIDLQREQIDLQREQIDLQREQIDYLQGQIDLIKKSLFSLSDRNVTFARRVDVLVAEGVLKPTGAKGPDDTISSSLKPLLSNASDSSSSKDPQSGASQASQPGELNLSASQASQPSIGAKALQSATKALEFLGFRTPPPAKTRTYFSSRKPQENPKSPNPKSPNPPEAQQNSSQKEYYMARVENKKSYYFRTRNVEFIIPFDNIKKEFNYDNPDNRQLFADELRGLFIKFSEQNKPNTGLTDDALMKNFKGFFSIHKFNFDFTRTHFKDNPPNVNSPEDIREFIKFFIALKSEIDEKLEIDKNQAATYSPSSDHDLVTQPSSSPSLSHSGNRKNPRHLESNSPSPARSPSPLEASIEPTKSCGR